MICSICSKDLSDSGLRWRSHFKRVHGYSSYREYYDKYILTNENICRYPSCGQQTLWNNHSNKYKMYCSHSHQSAMLNVLYPNMAINNGKRNGRIMAQKTTWDQRSRAGKVGGKRTFQLYPNHSRNIMINLNRKDPTLASRAGLAAVKKLFQSRVPNGLESDFEYSTGLKYNNSIFLSFKSGKHKVPDFIKNKKVIELFGDYWHQGEDPTILINNYKEIGYSCLIVWESEWYNNKLYFIDKVRKFINE